MHDSRRDHLAVSLLSADMQKLTLNVVSTKIARRVNVCGLVACKCADAQQLWRMGKIMPIAFCPNFERSETSAHPFEIAI